MSSDGYRNLGPPANSYSSQPESESGSNQPYSMLPPRISRNEYNAIAQSSYVEGGAPAVNEEVQSDEVTSSSSRRKKGRPKAGNPLEIFVKAQEEERRIREWLNNEAGEEVKKEYEEELRRQEEERKRKDELEKERIREYNRQRYQRKKEQRQGGGH